MNRWTQYEEDACRLPEGFQRVAYDADTQRYTFRDRNGALFQSAPGESYGKLTPLSNGQAESWRYDGGLRISTKLPRESPPTSFHDILPPQAITSASPTSSESEENLSMSPRARFIDAAKRSTVPRMQGVVHNLRRSVTSAKKYDRALFPPGKELDSDKVALLGRSNTVASRSSTKSDMSLVSLSKKERLN